MAVDRRMKPCRYIGCTALVVGGGYCAKHNKAYERQYDKQRGSPTARGYNARWQRARHSYLLDNPVCVVCGRPATVVDHIKPHKGDHELFWDTDNWQPLCKPCHDAKTARGE